MHLQQNCLQVMQLAGEPSLCMGAAVCDHPSSPKAAAVPPGTAPPQECCSVCQAHPWACAVAWDAAPLPAWSLRTSGRWHETRERLDHCICLCADTTKNLKQLLWDREVREGIFHLSHWLWEALLMLVCLLFYWAAVLWHMWVQCSENSNKKHLTGQLVSCCPIWLLPLKCTTEARQCTCSITVREIKIVLEKRPVFYDNMSSRYSFAFHFH